MKLNLLLSELCMLSKMCSIDEVLGILHSYQDIGSVESRSVVYIGYYLV